MPESKDLPRIEIKGLKSEGPGDIVGAIASNTGLSPRVLGDIDIQNGRAVVEIEPEAVDHIVKIMDRNQIGRSKVRVNKLEEEDELDPPEQYVEQWTELVQLEREQEMREHEEEIKKLSGQERESKGRAILHLRGRDEGEDLSGFLVKFMRNKKGEELPEIEISVGDLVMLSKNDPLRDDNPTGTVVATTKYSVTVSFREKPQGFVYDKDLRMDLYVNDITYQRMLDAIDTIEGSTGDLRSLFNIINGSTEPTGAVESPVEFWHNEQLNESQQDAVKHALGSREFFLIHGPPGTGKTTTVIEVIQQAIEKRFSVLATAASNTAVDNLVEFLVDQGVHAVRLGHPARVTPALQEHTLDALVMENEAYQHARELRDEAFEIKDKQDDETHPSGRWRRGLSDTQIKQLAEEERSTRGVPADKIKEMAEWLELEEKADKLFSRSDELMDHAIDEVLQSADVVCTTNSTAGSDLIEGQTFDVLVIDEATQATEPSCLIPITHANRVIMAGDHRQLPPTIKNQKAAQQGMERTLFEKLAEEYGDEIMRMLSIQYRMHETIMKFASDQFYKGKLQADANVRQHTLEDLDIELGELETPYNQIMDPTKPLVFVNTRDMGAQERSREGSHSKENQAEADIVCKLVREYLEAGILPEQIAVIAPYDDQVQLIDQMLGEEQLEVKTVDGFQGREKEIVIISMTRSNMAGEIGFLSERRRFNVALTRAKRKAIVIGDEATINKERLYRDFVQYAEKTGGHIIFNG